MNSTDSISKEVDRLYREHSGKLVPSLVSFFRLSDLELAEDIVQETFIAALRSWTEKGVPDDPLAWLYKVCKNRAVNELEKKYIKNRSSFPASLRSLSDNSSLDLAFLPDEIKDNQLRMLFATCHPDFPPKSRIILTLKTLAGFKTEEIANGLGMNVEAVKKNLTRTRQQIQTENIPLRVPFRMQSRERLGSVHQVLYLIFNEGYRASSGDDLIRKDLCLQAMRLAKALLDEEKVSTPDTQALFALMLFNVARFEARVNTEGNVIELADQNRALWDQELIREGIRFFNLAKGSEHWSKYHFEAAIASLHCTAPSFEETRWPAIVSLYDRLLETSNSPFVKLNRNIALHYSGNAQQALENLLALKGLEENSLYHATLGDIYQFLGKLENALNSYLEAIKNTSLKAEKMAFLKKIEWLKNE